MMINETQYTIRRILDDMHGHIERSGKDTIDPDYFKKNNWAYNLLWDKMITNSNPKDRADISIILNVLTENSMASASKTLGE